MLRHIMAALVIVAAPLRAQNLSGQDTILLDRSYTDTVASSRVTLLKNTVYKLDLSHNGARPRFVALRQGVYPPRALRIRDSGGRLGGAVYEVHVDRDGEYDVGVAGLFGSESIRLSLSADAGATLHREARLNEPGWALGVRAEFGRHSGYVTGATPDSPESGSAYDACVLIGYANRTSLCLGGGADVRGGGDSRVTWIFAELQVRLLQRNKEARLPTNLGLILRVASGNTGSAVSRDPSFYGGGAYLQQALTQNARGRGISVLGSLQYGVLRNITVKGEHATLLKLGLQWLP